MKKQTIAFCAAAAMLSLNAMAAEHATAHDDYGPIAGNWELTLGGQGNNDKDFTSGSGSINGSLGFFVTDAFELSLRQGFAHFENDQNGHSGTMLSTKIAADYHFNLGRFRPFVGVNFGGLYGDEVTDTFAAGLEGGVKYYVLPKTFIQGTIDYTWNFRSGNQIDNTFNDGFFGYGVGIGFNF